jgi:hypothetical protein
MVVNGLTDILVKAAEGEKVIVALPGTGNSFEPNAFYGIDGVTEKVTAFFTFGSML